jgi:hypothetical protein
LDQQKITAEELKKEAEQDKMERAREENKTCKLPKRRNEAKRGGKGKACRQGAGFVATAKRLSHSW